MNFAQISAALTEKHAERMANERAEVATKRKELRESRRRNNQLGLQQNALRLANGGEGNNIYLAAKYVMQCVELDVPDVEWINTGKADLSSAEDCMNSLLQSLQRHVPDKMNLAQFLAKTKADQAAVDLSRHRVEEGKVHLTAAYADLGHVISELLGVRGQLNPASRTFKKEQKRLMKIQAERIANFKDAIESELFVEFMSDEQKCALLWKARREIEALSTAVSNVIKNETYKRHVMESDPQLADVVAKCLELKRQIRSKEHRLQVMQKIDM